MTQILKDAFISVNGRDICDSVTAITLGLSNETQESKTMGDDTATEIPGLKVISCSADLEQDFSDDGLDEFLFGLVNDQTISQVQIRPKKSEVVSASNPQYSFYAFVSDYPILGNGVGDKATTSITLTPAKDGVNTPNLTRTTS